MVGKPLDNPHIGKGNKGFSSQGWKLDYRPTRVKSITRLIDYMRAVNRSRAREREREQMDRII